VANEITKVFGDIKHHHGKPINLRLHMWTKRAQIIILDTKLIFCSILKPNGKILLAFCQWNQGNCWDGLQNTSGMQHSVETKKKTKCPVASG